MQPGLQIYLFGNLEIFYKSRRLEGFACLRARELLAFLALQPDHAQQRARIASVFWGHLEENRARKALNTEIWRLGAAMRAVGADPETRLLRTPQEIGFVPQDGDWVDLGTFSDGLDILPGLDPANAADDQIAMIERAVAVYRGDLLESVYSDWCFVQREALRARQVAALEFLLRARMERHDWVAAISHGQRLLAMDNLMEHVHRALMRCHYLSGNRPAAMLQFSRCEKLLRDELGVEPMEETRRVQETILSVRPRSPDAVAAKAARQVPLSRDPSKTPAQKVDLALANINTAAGWLEDASRELREPR